MKRSISPKELAKAIGASESSVKRWCDNGSIVTSYTPGGHRKIEVNEALQFLRKSRYAVEVPEQLGLPVSVGKKEWANDEAVAFVFDALAGQQEESVIALVMDLYLSGRSLASIFDEVLSVALEDIGDEWECGSLEIHKERQACQICRRVIDQLRQVTRISNARFSALGGTLSGDYYELPTLMIETVLRDHGWNAMSLGTNLPGSAFFGAIEAEKPDLVWLSLSHVEDRARTVADVNGLWERLDSNVPLIVGGRALTEELRRDIRYTAFCDTVGQLEDFLQSYHRNRTGAETNPSLN